MKLKSQQIFVVMHALHLAHLLISLFVRDEWQQVIYSVILQHVDEQGHMH